MNLSRVVVACAIASLATGCGGEAHSQTTQRAPGKGAPLAGIEALSTPTGTGAAEPFLFSGRGGVLLSWLEPVAGTDRHALRFSRFREGKWSAPRTIVDRNDLFVNWADFPSIVEDEKGVLFAHWLQKSGPGTYSYDVMMSTSADGGSSWSKPFLLNRDGKQAEHGFVTLAPLPGGGVGATWLDGRNMTSGADHGHESMGDMTLRYAVVSSKGALTGETELDPRTCECCTTGMAVSSRGPVIVYRDRSADEVRDVSYVVREGKAFTKPRTVNVDGWKIAGCPVNGPQIDAIGDRVATAWFTAAAEQGRAYVAFSTDGGATFAKPIGIDGGKPVGRLDVLLLDTETALVTWLEQTANGAEIRARRVRRNGTVEPSIKIAEASTARAGGFARMARSNGEIFFAWTEQKAAGDKVQKSIRLARLRVSA